MIKGNVSLANSQCFDESPLFLQRKLSEALRSIVATNDTDSNFESQFGWVFPSFGSENRLGTVKTKGWTVNPLSQRFVDCVRDVAGKC